MESASAFIDQKIKELADWRGKTLAKVRDIIHAADPEIVILRSGKSGSGRRRHRRELPSGPTAASSARERPTRTSSK